MCQTINRVPSAQDTGKVGVAGALATEVGEGEETRTPPLHSPRHH